MGNFHTMEALGAWLSSLGPQAHAFRCEAEPTIEKLQADLVEVFSQIKGIQDAADSEGRGLTKDEVELTNELWNEHDQLEKDISRRKQIVDAAARMSESMGRKTEPRDKVNPDDEPHAHGNAVAPTSSRKLPAQVIPQAEKGRWGWQSFGHFAKAVQAAAVPGRGQGQMDPRLVKNAPTTFGTEGVGEEGGFAIPPDFRTAIVEKVMGPESLISRTDQLTSNSNNVTIPVDETTPWQTSGGILAFWAGEADQLTQSKPQLRPRHITLDKLTALVPVTDELLEDASLIDSYLRRKAPEKMDFKISDAIFNGTGAGQPLGILNSGAVIEVSAESGQAADTIVFDNINKMYSRMYAPWRANAVWLINQDIEPQLHALNHPGDSSPVFMPPGGLSDSPFGRLMGRPIVPHEVAKTLGDVGDITLVDFRQYMTVRKTAGVRIDTSIHLFFDYDMTAFRFIMRVAGMPWWNSVITRANGTNTLSWAVTLAARA